MVVLPGKAHAVSCQSHVHVRVRVRMECLLLFYPNIYIAGLHFNLRLALSSTNTFPPLLTTQRVPESRLLTRMERLRAHPPTILISSPHFVDCYIHTQICFTAYDIRLYAIKNFGAVIHEFDPWFNFRATQYLSDNGWNAFSTWFDHLSW